ncbi:MAG: RES domain-containing protein [Proteobacteria bacterium]|jgi:hypothetical protein|nr:RES family NAD+ phosphorylase [Alphaproteobacteria bacterium]NCC04186.1 RES domain-containing protein [Pseudomonadota bacterium]
MSEHILCSNCFLNHGLQLQAATIGKRLEFKCPNCGTCSGYKLTEIDAYKLSEIFFVKGSYHRSDYGGSPTIQCNQAQYGVNEINPKGVLNHDIRLLENKLGIGFFLYGPRMWMIGYISPLEELQEEQTRIKVVEQILDKFPVLLLQKEDIFYRLRLNVKNEASPDEYDSPPEPFLGKGRLDSTDFPVLYCSQDIEGCIHECRTTYHDEMYIASLAPKSSLKLIDLSAHIDEPSVTEFESLNLSIHFLFYAGDYSYEITRCIAKAAYERGYDGLIYPSYYTLARKGLTVPETTFGLSNRLYKPSSSASAIPNICVFGRPLAEGKVDLVCINRMYFTEIKYDYRFAPLKTEL